MNRRTSIFVVGLLVAALLGVILMAAPGSPAHQEPTLGLDLQGGLEVTLQAVPPPDRELTEDDLNRSVDIMRNRVDKLGVTEPEIRTQGSDQIVIQLPGVKDPTAAAEIIGTTAQLELYDLETSLTGPSIAARLIPVEHSSLYDLLARVQSQATGRSDAYYLVNPKTKKVRQLTLTRAEVSLPNVSQKLEFEPALPDSVAELLLFRVCIPPDQQKLLMQGDPKKPATEAAPSATPSATSVVPRLHARPKESLTTMPTSTPVSSSSAFA